jgi:hypothetical protein
VTDGEYLLADCKTARKMSLARPSTTEMDRNMLLDGLSEPDAGAADGISSIANIAENDRRQPPQR